jgi:hypothetical protein
MKFELAAGVSFCACAGRFVFLDRNSGRYFALGEDANSGFARWIAGEPLDSQTEAMLAAMARQGLLNPSEAGQLPEPCRSPPVASRSVVGDHGRVSPGAVAWAMMRIAASRLALRRQPLAQVLERLASRKSKLGLGEPTEEDLIEVAGAFTRGRLLASPLDQCLPGSIAVVHALLDRTCRSDLVIGVQLRPFAAHCWVQSGNVVINETLDQVRNFTPVLVL